MATIDKFNGIKIHIYNGEHRPPHIHADYNEYEVLINIEDKHVHSGYLPNKQLKQVFQWLELNSDWALNIFYELNQNLK